MGDGQHPRGRRCTRVAYAGPPFVDTGRFTVPVNGSGFLHVILFPGMRHETPDPTDFFPTYLDSETIMVNQGSVYQVVFAEGSKATME